MQQSNSAARIGKADMLRNAKQYEKYHQALMMKQFYKQTGIKVEDKKKA